MTSNLRWAGAPGNVRLSARTTCLSKDSVGNVSQIVVCDKFVLTARVGKLPQPKLKLLFPGIGTFLGGFSKLRT